MGGKHADNFKGSVLSVESYDSILGLLRCPSTHAALIADKSAGQLVSEDESKTRYRIASGVPVLIDFSKSVIPEVKGLESPVVRGRNGVLKGMAGTLKRVINGRSDTTARNCELFLKKLKTLTPNPTVLVIGGATVGDGAESLYDDSSVRLIALDVYLSENLSIIADAHDVPLRDGTVDGVWIQAVLEHVLQPQTVVEEIWRVLRKDGVVYSETPFMQMVHEGAYDYSRFSELGHRVLFGRFEAIDTGSVAGPFTVLRWSIRYAVAGLFRSRTAGSVAWALTFWLRFFDKLIPRSHTSDGASCVYFFGTKRNERVPLRDVARGYRGAQ